MARTFPHALALAIAQDLNDELTIVIAAAEEGIRKLPLGHPVRQELIEIRAAAARCADIAAHVLSHSVRSGGRGSAATAHQLMEAAEQ